MGISRRTSKKIEINKYGRTGNRKKRKLDQKGKKLTKSGSKRHFGVRQNRKLGDRAEQGWKDAEEAKKLKYKYYYYNIPGAM